MDAAERSRARCLAKVVLASAFATGFAFTHRRRGIELKETKERKRKINEKNKIKKELE